MSRQKDQANTCPLCGSKLPDAGLMGHLEEPYPKVVPKHMGRCMVEIGGEAARLKESGKLTWAVYRALVYEAIRARSYDLEQWVRGYLEWDEPFGELGSTSLKMQLLGSILGRRILKLGKDVQKVWDERARRWEVWHIDYRKSSTFVRIAARKKSLAIFIQVGERDIIDPKGWTAKVTNLGKLNTKFRLDSVNQLDYAMSLIQQAYDYAL